MANSKDYYLYLFSSVPTTYTSHKNNLFQFFTELNNPIILDKDVKYECALSELFYPPILGSDSLFFFVYSDICDFTHVGHSLYRVMRPIMLRNQPNNFVCNYDRYQSSIYIPLSVTRIDTIELHLHPDLDLPINGYNFPPGDIIATIHIRPIIE